MTHEKLVQQHIAKECKALTVKCPLDNCGKLFKRSESENHFNNECDAVQVPCK